MLNTADGHVRKSGHVGISRVILSVIDLYDVVVVAGLVMLGVGLWMIYPPAALIVIGALFLLIGLMGAVLKAKA